MNGLILAAWLTLGWLPQGAVVAYEPTALIDVSFSGRVELGAEVSWGPLFAGGSMNVPVWYTGDLSFWPIQLSSTFTAGLDFGVVRLGWKHNCAHPVTPYLPIVEYWEGELVPYFDSAYDELFVTFKVGGRKP
jgi:hypothetical protein